MRARLAHRPVGVRRSQHPCGAGDGCPRQAAWMPGAVEALAVLHRDGSRARPAPATAAASARSGTAPSAAAPAPPRPGASACPGSRCDTPSLPKQCTRPARRTSRTSAGDMPSLAAASAARSATARAWPSEYGDFRSMKSATASSACVESLADQHHGERGLGPDHRFPGVGGVQARQQHLGVRVELVRQVRVELLAPLLRASALAASTPPTRWATSANSPMAASLAAIGTSPPLQLAGPALAVPLLVGRVQRVQGLLREAESSPRRRAISEWWAIIALRSRWPDTTNSRPTRNRSRTLSLPDPTRRSPAAALFTPCTP